MIERISSKNVIYLEAERLFTTALGKLSNVNILLDIGCGIVPQKYIKANVHICCEPFYQYVEVLQKNVLKNRQVEHNGTSYAVMNATWDQVLNFFPERSVDSVFLIDVVEHLKKEDALELIKKTEKIVKKQIAIFTPLGFLPQEHPDGKDAWGLDGGAWQEHKSGWLPQDFDVSWDILVAEVFHTANNMGKEFDTPHGALWAIKTFDSISNYVSYEEKNRLIDENLIISKKSQKYKIHAAIEKLTNIF